MGRALLLLALMSASASANPARRLEAAWRQLHANEEVPAPCRQQDPVQVLTADVDATPGRETVLASRRWGVVMLDAAGHPIASWPLSCGGWSRTPDRVALAAVRASGLSATDLLVRTRVTGHCGEFHQWTLLRRVDRNLDEMFQQDEYRDRACGMSPHELIRGQIEVVRPGVLRVTSAGTIAPAIGGGHYGAAQPIRDVTLWRLRDGRFRQDAAAP